MFSRFAGLWKRLPVSRKIFFSGIIFLACFSLFGEGMEHREENFAEEVMSQIK